MKLSVFVSPDLLVKDRPRPADRSRHRGRRRGQGCKAGPEHLAAVSRFFQGVPPSLIPSQPFFREADRHHVHRPDRESTTRAGIGLRQSKANVLRPEPFQLVVPILGVLPISVDPARHLIGKTVSCHVRSARQFTGGSISLSGIDTRLYPNELVVGRFPLPFSSQSAIESPAVVTIRRPSRGRRLLACSHMHLARHI